MDSPSIRIVRYTVASGIAAHLLHHGAQNKRRRDVKVPTHHAWLDPGSIAMTITTSGAMPATYPPREIFACLSISRPLVRLWTGGGPGSPPSLGTIRNRSSFGPSSHTEGQDGYAERNCTAHFTIATGMDRRWIGGRDTGYACRGPGRYGARRPGTGGAAAATSYSGRGHRPGGHRLG